MGRKIVVTSGKGGVGKTTLTASLGIAIAETGKKVVLVDADIGLNNLDVVLAVENKVVYDVLDVISGKCRLKQALIQDVDNPTLYVLPSAKIQDSPLITACSFRNVVDALALNFDFVIIDCPAGIDNGFHRAVSAATEAIVVTTPHISAVRDADKVLSILSGYCLMSVGLVVNRVRGDMVSKGEMMSAGDSARRQMRTRRRYPRGRLHHDVFADGKSAFRHDFGARLQDACVKRHKRHEKHLRLRFARGARHKNQEVFRTVKKMAKLASERLKNVILSDKVSHPDRLNDLLKSDVNDMLKTYFELYPGSIKVCLKPSEYGLDILIDATAIRVKDFGSFGE